MSVSYQCQKPEMSDLNDLYCKNYNEVHVWAPIIFNNTVIIKPQTPLSACYKETCPRIPKILQ